MLSISAGRNILALNVTRGLMPIVHCMRWREADADAKLARRIFGDGDEYRRNGATTSRSLHSLATTPVRNLITRRSACCHDASKSDRPGSECMMSDRFFGVAFGNQVQSIPLKPTRQPIDWRARTGAATGCRVARRSPAPPVPISCCRRDAISAGSSPAWVKANLKPQMIDVSCCPGSGHSKATVTSVSVTDSCNPAASPCGATRRAPYHRPPRRGSFFTTCSRPLSASSPAFALFPTLE
jgi:hypothetical protein